MSHFPGDQLYIERLTSTSTNKLMHFMTDQVVQERNNSSGKQEADSSINRVSHILTRHTWHCYSEACNTPYVNCGEAMNRRHGWSSLVVTHLLCVQCVCVLLCQLFDITASHGYKVTFFAIYCRGHYK